MDLLEKIEEAGIVGCGGAGFPTHIKYKGAQIDFLLINGLECEPMLGTDKYLMRHFPHKIIKAAEEAGKATNAKEIYIVLKNTYKKEKTALENAARELSSPVSLHLTKSFYPAGDEQNVVYEATGRVVPPGGIPLDVGCIVSNVATMICIADAIEGIPFTEKYVTVAGLVKEPSILRVPVGMPVTECIRLAGGGTEDKGVVVIGGPMMGKPLKEEEAASAVVTKTTSGILILPERSKMSAERDISWKLMINRARSACIQCRICTDMCPRHLLGHPLEPHRIMRTLTVVSDIKDALSYKPIQNAALCCECGVCEWYACPMGLVPRKINSMIKERLRKAGIRYRKEDISCSPDLWREGRKVPSHRLAARIGVEDFYNAEIDKYKEGKPSWIEIPLNMHIGSLAVPLVKTGDQVIQGQMIASPPAGHMGAKIHTGISGKVVSTNGRIVIEREEAVK